MTGAPPTDENWLQGNGGRFWAGGLATALVAALVAAAGSAIAQGVLDIDLLPPDDPAGSRWPEAFTYAAWAAGLALVCTAVAHLLVLAVPRPMSFFRWIVTLIGVVLVAGCFAPEAALESKIATAVVVAVVMISIGTLLAGLLRRLRHQPVEPPATYPPTTPYPPSTPYPPPAP